MTKTTRTIYAIDLLTALTTKHRYKPIEHTLLNEKFNILPNDILLGKEYPDFIKYFGIGSGGANIVANSNIIFSSKHSPLDAALYNQIPFIARPIDNDLNEVERKLYRFRKEVVKDGTIYALYYLKLVNYVDSGSNFYLVNSDSNNKILSLYAPDKDKPLNPLPENIRSITNDTSITYIMKSIRVDLSLSSTELQEIKDACSLIYDTIPTKITELGLFSGVDRFDTTTLRNEASNVQAMYFIETGYDIDLYLNGDGISHFTDIGGMEYTITEPIVNNNNVPGL